MSKTPTVDITEWEHGVLQAMADMKKSVVVIRALPNDPPDVQTAMYQYEASFTKFLGLGFVEDVTEQAKKSGADIDREFKVFKPTQLVIKMFESESSCGDPECDNCLGEPPKKQWVN